MDIQLPKRIDGGEVGVLQNARQVTVIGANGSGKTRFCNELMASHRGKAYRLSALKALFPINSDKEPLEGSIDAMFQHINDMSPQVKNSANTEFDRLTYIMMLDEFRDLMNYKAHLLLGEPV